MNRYSLLVFKAARYFVFPAIMTFCGNIIQAQSLTTASANGLQPIQLPTSAESDSGTACTITNIQGLVNAATFSLFGTPGGSVFTYFDPEGSAGPNDPGCFVSQPYPFHINAVNLTMGDPTLFNNPASPGTLKYQVKIYNSLDNAGCHAIDALVFSSDTVSLAINNSAYYDQNIPINVDVNGPFFVAVVSDGWSGTSNAAPSCVLWDNESMPNCRQYLSNNGGSTVLDFNAFYTSNSGWDNVSVVGAISTQGSVYDLALSNLNSSGGSVLNLGVSNTFSATVSNVGPTDVLNGHIGFFVNNVMQAEDSVSILAGNSTNVSFDYSPISVGTINVDIRSLLASDSNNQNDTVSGLFDVQANCVVTDNFDSYNSDAPLTPQTSNWVTGNNSPGGSMDALVTHAQYLSPPNSLQISSSSTNLSFLLGNQTSGIYKISAWCYLPSGGSGEINLKKSDNARGLYLQFNGDGTGTMIVDGDSVAVNYPQDSWFPFNIVADISDSIANAYVANTLTAQWNLAHNIVGAPGEAGLSKLDFNSPAFGNPNMFVDDVSICSAVNDNQCSAFELMPEHIIQGNNTNISSTDQQLVGDCWADGPSNDASVWFKCTVPANGDYQVTTNLEPLENTDTQLAIYSSSNDSCSGTLTQIGCNDDVSLSSGNLLSTAFLTGMQAGQVIFIQVDSYNPNIGGSLGTFQIEFLNASAPVNDYCSNATDLSSLLGGPLNQEVNSQTMTNQFASVSPGDTSTTGGAACWISADGAQATVWTTFTGDGNTYIIHTNNCNGQTSTSNYLNDSQLAIYTGNCNNLSLVACNDDYNTALGYEAGDTLQTENGTTYYMMFDGYLGAEGDFCVGFTRLQTSGVQEVAQNNLKIYPNPASNRVYIESSYPILEVNVINTIGQQVIAKKALGTARSMDLDLSSLSRGMYFIKVQSGSRAYEMKLVKE